MLTFDEARRSAVELTFCGSAFVGPDKQADCEAAGGVWNADTKTCSE